MLAVSKIVIRRLSSLTGLGELVGSLVQALNGLLSLDEVGFCHISID